MKSFKLEMKRIGSLFYVNVYFYKLKTNEYKECWIALDTGAETTTLSNDLLYNLEYNVSDYPLTKITSATKRENSNRIILDKLKLGDFELNNIEVNSLDFANPYISGVIGLNVFTKFDVNFLFSQNIIEFTLRNDI
jgi:predicted aspartyl protease